MLKVEDIGALPRVARAVAARAKAETGADGVALVLTDGPTVRFRYGVGVLEGEGGADVFGSVQAAIGQRGVRSVISVPLLASHRPCGEMTAVRCGPVAFDEADSDALNQLASLVGDAIESAWELRNACGWLALESAPIGMAVSAIDGTFLEVNQTFAACLGWPRHELVGRTFQSICHPEDVGLSQRLLDRAIAEGSTAFRMEDRYRRADGSVVWADLSVTIVRDAGGEARRLISQVVDVTDRVEAELLLAHRASHDRLTGLPNRRRFTAAVAAAATTAQRYGTSIAVLFLNLDRFKVVNESIGHEGGDVLLCEVARRLRLAAGSAETVGRFGADAFAILCEGVKGPEGARWIAAHMLTSLHQPVLVGGREVRAAASVGVALGGAARPTSAAVLLREADAACSLAKARGGGSVAMFDEALRNRAEERLDVEAALHHTVGRQELRLAYQPQIDLRTGQLAGFEALLRWEHPTLGLLTPETFIDVAEESGLVVEMGHWALAAAARADGRLAPPVARARQRDHGRQRRRPPAGRPTLPRPGGHRPGPRRPGCSAGPRGDRD